MKNNQLTFLSSSISTSFKWFWILLWRGSDGLRSTSIIPSRVAHNLSSFRKDLFAWSNAVFKSSAETICRLFIDLRFSSISARIVSILLFFIGRVLLLLKSYNVHLRFLGRSFVLSHLDDYLHLQSVPRGLSGRLHGRYCSYPRKSLMDFHFSLNNFMDESYKRVLFYLNDIYLVFSIVKSLKVLNVFFPSLVSSKTFHNLMAKLTNSRRFQHLLNRPTAPHAIFKKSTLKSPFSSPLSKWFGFASISKQVIIRSVKILIPQSIPATIRSAIISARIFSVNCGILLSKLFNVGKIRAIHLFLKIFKGSPQTFDSTTAITLESVMFRIVASLLNGRPNLIKPSSRHSVFHNLSLANGIMIVNQFDTPMWVSQLTDIWNKAHGK